MDTSELHQRISRLEGYLGQDPENARLRGDYVDLLIQAGRFDDARSNTQQALERAPTDQLSRYRLAVIEHHSNHLEASRDRLSALLEEGVDAPAVRFELAQVQAALNDDEASAQTLAELAAQDLPEDLAARVTFLHVRVLHRLGDLEGAIERAERFLRLRPGTPALVSALATLYLDAERLEDAARLVKLAEGSGSMDAEMLAVGGFVAIDAADLATAQQRFETSVSKAPEFGRASLGLGLTHAAAGRLGPAKAALGAATRSMPRHLGSWHALAWMHLLDREVDEAERAFNAALAVDRNFGDTYGGLAIVAALRGDRAGAEAHIRTGHRLDRRSLNVGVATAILRHGAMNTPAFLQSALQMLDKHALSNNAAMRRIFASLLGRRGP